jgi:cytochrome c2
MRRLTFIAVVLLLALIQCDQSPPKSLIAGGDSRRGAALIAGLGCGSCHKIPGVGGADGRVGPPLDNIGERTIIAGMLPNTPDNMVTWLRAPQSVVPGNAMPNLELNNHDARDVAAYLYTLR